jgi:hypothetical protein
VKSGLLIPSGTVIILVDYRDGKSSPIRRDREAHGLGRKLHVPIVFTLPIG